MGRTTCCVPRPMVIKVAVMAMMRGWPNLATKSRRRESSVAEEAERDDTRRFRATGIRDQAPRSPADAARPLRDSSQVERETMATEAALREEAEGGARPRQGMVKDVMRLLSMTIIDMGHHVMTVDFTGGTDDVIIGSMRCGKAKGRTGSERIAGPKGPEVTATATATGVNRHQLDGSLQRRLFRIVVAILSEGPFGVNPSCMKLE